MRPKLHNHAVIMQCALVFLPHASTITYQFPPTLSLPCTSSHSADINECSVYGTCSQLCHNTHGSYTCTCVAGYKMVEDPTMGRTCKAVGECVHGTQALPSVFDYRELWLPAMHGTRILGLPLHCIMQLYCIYFVCNKTTNLA